MKELLKREELTSLPGILLHLHLLRRHLGINLLRKHPGIHREAGELDIYVLRSRPIKENSRQMMYLVGLFQRTSGSRPCGPGRARALNRDCNDTY